jgi:hypothetical protein
LLKPLDCDSRAIQAPELLSLTDGVEEVRP